MKKKVELEVEDDEIIKAVAQAWHSHTGTGTGCSTSSNEFDAYRRNFKGKPSRFKLEAMSAKLINHKYTSTSTVKDNKYYSTPIWDYNKSLWDSYEIVTVAKKLEAGLVLDERDPFTITAGTGFLEEVHHDKSCHKKRKESKNSLRNWFKRVSSTSRRFNEACEDI